MYEKDVRVIYDDDFTKDVRKLPKRAEEKLTDLLMLLRKNPFDPQLHTKRLKPPLHKFFGFRITRDYRVGFAFISPDTVKLLAADNRDQIYKKLKRKL